MTTADVLVVHPGALGDVLLAVPALRALRRGGHGARVVLAAQPHVGALLLALGAVDLARRFESLGLEPLFVDDGAPARVAAISDAARMVCWFGARDATFTRRLRALAPSAVIASATGETTCPVWTHLLGTVGDDSNGELAPITLPKELVADGEDALRRAGWNGRDRVLFVHAGAGGLGKRWPVEGFARVVEAITHRRDLTVALHQGPADADAVAALTRQVHDVIVLEQPSLPALAGALGHAAALIGNDSGVTHLAAALGVPTIALFRPTNLAWRPWSASARVVVVETATLDEGDAAAVTRALAEALA